MTPQNFIDGLVECVYRPVVHDVIMSMMRPPTERTPPERSRKIEFYSQLTPDQRTMMGEVVNEAVRFAIFRFLCILDGVAFIEDGAVAGRFELYDVHDSDRSLLNDFKKELLHDIFNATCAK